MILTEENLSVTLGRIRMTSSRQTPQSLKGGASIGIDEWVLDQTALVGWFDGVDIDVNAVPRPNKWGDFTGPPRASSRLISVSGTAIARSPQDLQKMRDDLTSLFKVDKYAEISVTNNAGTRYATVSLEGRVEWAQALDEVAVFKLNLYAPDPRVYGPIQQVQIEDASPNGGIKYALKYPLNYNNPDVKNLQYISNIGSVDSWPTFVVTGNFPLGFELYDNRGHVVVYEGLVTMEAPVTIDMGRGVATQNGSDVSVLATKRQWFSIPPGATIRPSFSPRQDGVGWCDIIYRDTWI